MNTLRHAVETQNEFHWAYDTDEFSGVCELAGDVMVVKCSFASTGRAFYDVLAIDDVIRKHLLNPVSVERLADLLVADFPSLSISVSGRAKTHGWITARRAVRWGA